MAVIIYPPAIDWNWMTQRPQHLMNEFAKDGNEVYFCNWTQEKGKTISKIENNIYLVHNNRQFIKNLIPKIKRREKIILWISWPKLYPYVQQYFPDLVIYDLVDDFPEWFPDINKMIDKSNLVIVTSKKLKNMIRNNFPKKDHYLISNGCDIDHFQKYLKTKPKLPKEYKELKGPIICYMGAWAPWIDKELLRKLSIACKNANIVVIGAEFKAKYDYSLKNVKYIGQIPYQLLPQYLYYVDACIVPFKINKITIATNPIKVYEYLAANKPVISTNIPEVKKIPNVFIGESHQEFIRHTKNILTAKYPLDFAEVNLWLNSQSWDTRYQEIKKILNKYIS